MKTPIFIVCMDGEILVYPTVERALAYVESPDVEAGEYRAVFDAEGRPYALVVEQPTRRKDGWLLTSVELSPVQLVPSGSKADGEGLRLLLAERLHDGDSNSLLEDLVAQAARDFRSP